MCAPVSITEGNETKLSRRVDDEVLCHPADVRHSQARPHHELDNEVTVAHPIHAVLRNGVEPKLLGEELSVHRKRVARKRARA